MSVPVVFLIIAAAMAITSLVSYQRGGRILKSNARIWLRLAAIFAAMALYIFFSR